MADDPRNVAAQRQELIKIIFASALKGDKGTIKRCLRQTYADEEILVKDNPEAPGGMSKVRRKTIKSVLSNLGEILDSSGNSIIDVLVAHEKYLTAVNFMQDEELGLIKPFPKDVQRLFFKIRLKPENFIKLVHAAHEVLAAQDFQRRSFIRRLCYGQPKNERVLQFLKEHYEQVFSEIEQFHEKFGGAGH